MDLFLIFNESGDTLLRRVFLEEELDREEEKENSEPLAEHPLRNREREIRADKTAEEEGNADVGRDSEIHMARLVVLVSGQKSDGRDHEGEGCSLGPQLIKAEEVEKSGDDDDPASDSKDAGSNSGEESNGECDEGG